MTATTVDSIPEGRRAGSWIWHRQLDSYPNRGPRYMYLGITVLATVMLYYEAYVGGSVSTLLLQNLNITFKFFVVVTAIGALLGAFGSLAAGLSDRYGRANLVVWGVLITAIFVGFVLPTATNKWSFTIYSFVVGTIEGIILVATPALIRDFSPQTGRATAMGLWTSGPVLGSLVVAIVGSATIPAVVLNTRLWTHQYRICGTVGLIVFVITFFGLRELSPGLRDQLMVTMRDRALIEIRAKGIDIMAALRHPFRQLIKPDIVISSLAIAVFLLVYYTAVGFSVIYLSALFGFTLKNANGINNWTWGFNVFAVVLAGVLSDRLRVRKPFMLVGGLAAAVMILWYGSQFGHHPSYYKLAFLGAGTSFALGIAFSPWLASFTETVEDHNPALIATGLAIYGWILRMVVFLAFLAIPLVITSLNPLVQYGTNVEAIATRYAPQLAFAQSHPKVVALAQRDSGLLANAAKFAPVLAVMQAHPAPFTTLIGITNPAAVPPALTRQLIAAGGGGAKGAAILATFNANKPAIVGVVIAAPQLNTLKPYAAQLTALSKIPPAQLQYLQDHAASVQQAAAEAPGQWKDWYWICFGGVVFFLLSIPLLRGRWRTRNALKDEREHEEMVAAALEQEKVGAGA